MRPGGVAQGGVGVVERFDAGRVRGEEGDESQDSKRRKRERERLCVCVGVGVW